MKAITVRLDDETHRLVKVRAAQDGLPMEAIARVWFDAYGRGGTVVASTETTVRDRGLSAGEQPEVAATHPASSPDATAVVGHAAPEEQRATSISAAPAPAERPFQPDWKKGKR